MKPITGAVNQLLDRLRAAFEAERAFAANALGTLSARLPPFPVWALVPPVPRLATEMTVAALSSLGPFAFLAGEAATFIESGDRDDVGTGRENWSGDFESAMDYLERIFSVSDDVESPGNQAAYHYLESLFWRTVLLLRQPMWWEKVSAVANSLSEKRTLSFEECHGICLDDLLER